MHFFRALFASSLLAMSSVAFGESQPLGRLWHNTNGSIFITGCPAGGDHDDGCRAVSILRRNRIVYLGGGYTRVKLLWSRKSKASGPDVLILGDYGGSGGLADLFAVNLSSRISFRKLSGERFDSVSVRPVSGPLHFRVPFDVEFFNGAPHAGAIVVPLPARWTAGDFAIDMNNLIRRPYSESELDFRELAIRQELRAWSQDAFPASRLYPPESRDGTPVTATAVVEMMLSGHADQAWALLDRAWPRQLEHSDRPLGGKNAFWAALCRAVMSEKSWKRFGLARLPHAGLIEQGAKERG